MFPCPCSLIPPLEAPLNVSMKEANLTGDNLTASLIPPLEAPFNVSMKEANLTGDDLTASS